MTREEALEMLKYNSNVIHRTVDGRTDTKEVEALDMAIKALEQEPCEDTGEVSDGCHTFNQLYHQRAILFATIVNQNTDIAWKSYKHSDGKYCFDSNGEWFIVGVDTPEGSYTYHYSKEYWDYFECKELDCGKEWDGHTEEDVTRLLSLKKEPCEDAISREKAIRWVKTECNPYGKPTLDFESGKKVIKHLEQMSSVTPQPKVGKWIYDYITADGHRTYHCSKCGCFLKPKHSEPLNSFKWCSLCGAKMQQELK